MLTIQCDQHPDYVGLRKPEYDCPACRCLRALCLEAAPADVAAHVQNALAFGLLRVADQPAPTETAPLGPDDAQALADVRTLDDWARECFGGWNTAPGFRAQWYRCSVYNAAMATKTFDGRTPDEARAKAAAWVREQAR